MTETKRRTLTIGTKSVEKSSSAASTGVRVERRRRIFRPTTASSGSAHSTDRLKSILSAAKKSETEDLRKKQENKALEEKRRKLLQQDQVKTEKVREKLSEAQVQQESVQKEKTRNTPDRKTEKSRYDRKDEEKSSKKNFKDDSRRKLTVNDIMKRGGETGDTRRMSVASIRRRLEKQKKQHSDASEESDKKIVRTIQLPETISVKDLATRMSEKSGAVVKKLMELGVIATINQVIDADTAELVISEFGHQIQRIGEGEVVEKLLQEFTENKDVKEEGRAPVVTIMGHVDHGKTTLLDSLRETDVVSGEAGGITQHIGAYQVSLKSGAKITFIDTPGHAAFSAMRSRGAKVTDIVVIVVAANDGIKPQTIEAISHSKAAGVPIIIAVNKMDLPDADSSKVKTELLSHEIVVEDMGGEVQCIEISAKEKLNLDKLEEAILLQSEILEIKAPLDSSAQGTVVEAKMEKGLGATATTLIQKGTLKIGDIFVSGMCAGRVRALRNSYGENIKEAHPSEPVMVLGFSQAPEAGDDFIVLNSEAKAREIADYRVRKYKEKKMIQQQKSRMEMLMAGAKEGKVQILSVILKADVQGSIEAIIESANKIESDKIKVQFIHSAVGGINETDMTLAKTMNAMIIGFNVRANTQAREISRAEKIDLRYYSIIYDVVDDFKLIMEGMLEPEIKETILGYADVLDIFTVGKGTKVAGCRVTEGTIKRSGKIRLIRDDVVLYAGEIGQMKHGKDDAKEAKAGSECGLSFANYNDISVGDKIECFTEEKLAVKL